MACGLGMTEEEWAELKGKVDNSFWVMRVIGNVLLFLSSADELNVSCEPLLGYPPLPEDHDGFSCGAHRWLIHLFYVDAEAEAHSGTGTMAA